MYRVSVLEINSSKVLESNCCVYEVEDIEKAKKLFNELSEETKELYKKEEYVKLDSDIKKVFDNGEIVVIIQLGKAKGFWCVDGVTSGGDHAS